VVYMPQEGRGIGLANKVAAYALQELGLDTVDANRELGLPDDARRYGAVREILSDLDVSSVQLMTNNPRKIEHLERLGVTITKRIPCESPKEKLSEYSKAYINAKVARMGHLMEHQEVTGVLGDLINGTEPGESIPACSDLVGDEEVEEAIEFSDIESAVQVVRDGGMVVVMDDEGRENEGDIIMMASLCTAKQVAFTVRYTTGILCAPMTQARADELELTPMVARNGDPNGTAFTVTCDAVDTTTGVSARDRMVTFHTLADGKFGASSITRPGHVFPLVAKDGGVLVRGGHTESGVDLCRLAAPHQEPVALIAELTNDDGEMMRLPECAAFAKVHGLPLITVEALQMYLRLKNNSD